MEDIIVDAKDKKDDNVIVDVKETKWLTTRMSSDENKNVEGTKTVVNTAVKQCQRSVASSNI